MIIITMEDVKLMNGKAISESVKSLYRVIVSLISTH